MVRMLVGAELPPAVLRATTRRSWIAAELSQTVVLVVPAGTCLMPVNAVWFHPRSITKISSLLELSSQEMVARNPFMLTSVRLVGAAGACAVSLGVIANWLLEYDEPIALNARMRYPYVVPGLTVVSLKLVLLAASVATA